MADITPQDLSNSLSVLEFLLKYAEQKSDTQMSEEIKKLISDYTKVIEEPDVSDFTLLPYNRRDAYSILEYLKLQAEQLSEGRWTDFSDSDIGTVFLKLMSYLADMNNFQIDKVASELYLDTCTERASALALCALIGYEPRHYQSAYCDITVLPSRADYKQPARRQDHSATYSLESAPWKLRVISPYDSPFFRS